MTAGNRFPVYIRQMIEASANAVAFIEDMDEAQFMTDVRTQHAVAMSLMIVGEAASRITADYPEFARTHASIPWHSIRGIRNRIAHGYFDIDLHVVWMTVQAELPPLILRLRAIQFDARK